MILEFSGSDGIALGVTSISYGIILLIIITIESILLDSTQIGKRKIERKEKGKYTLGLLQNEVKQDLTFSLLILIIAIVGFIGLGLGWYKEGGIWIDTSTDEFGFILGGSLFIAYAIHTILFNVISKYRRILEQGGEDISLDANINVSKANIQVRATELDYKIKDAFYQELLSQDKLVIGKKRISVWTKIDVIMLLSIILHPLLTFLFAYTKKAWISGIVFASLLIIITYLFQKKAKSDFMRKMQRESKMQKGKELRTAWEIGQFVFTVVLIFLVWLVFQPFIPSQSIQDYQISLILVETFASIGLINRSAQKRRKVVFCKNNPNHKICRD